jgi:hypothetical protein
MSKLRQKEVKQFLSGHALSKLQSEDLNLDIPVPEQIFSHCILFKP